MVKEQKGQCDWSTFNKELLELPYMVLKNPHDLLGETSSLNNFYFFLHWRKNGQFVLDIDDDDRDFSFCRSVAGKLHSPWSNPPTAWS